MTVHRHEAAGVEQHDLLANRREVVFHLVVVEGWLFDRTSFSKRPQAGNVPLAVAQVEEEAVFGFLLETWKDW